MQPCSCRSFSKRSEAPVSPPPEGPPTRAGAVGAAGWTQAPWLLLKCGGGAARWPDQPRQDRRCLCAAEVKRSVQPRLSTNDKVHPPTRRSAMTSPHKHSQSTPTPSARPAKTSMQFKRFYLQVLDEFAVVKLDGRDVAGLGQGQVEPHRRPFLGFSPGTIPAGTTSCPGRCLHLSGSGQVEIALILQSALPRFGGCSSCEGRQGDKLHFSRFGHLDELAASFRTQKRSYLAKLLPICVLKKVWRSPDGCSVPRRRLRPPPQHTNYSPRDATVGEKLFFSVATGILGVLGDRDVHRSHLGFQE